MAPGRRNPRTCIEVARTLGRFRSPESGSDPLGIPGRHLSSRESASWLRLRVPDSRRERSPPLHAHPLATSAAGTTLKSMRALLQADSPGRGRPRARRKRPELARRIRWRAAARRGGAAGGAHCLARLRPLRRCASRRRGPPRASSRALVSRRARALLAPHRDARRTRAVPSSGRLRPDLASVRGGEAGSSAEYFGADLILLSLPDGGGGRAASLGAGHRGCRRARREARGVYPGRSAGDRPHVRSAPRNEVSSGPPRARGARPRGRRAPRPPPPVYLLETRLEIDTEAPAFRFRPAAAGMIRFDANELLTWRGARMGRRRVEHGTLPSQFDAVWQAAVSRVPEGDRDVFLAPAEAILNRPVSTCP